MKKTQFFKSQKEMLDYYGGNVSYIPSNTLAIVGDEDNFVLFSTSNNQSMNGSMEDQGGYIDNISGYAYVTTNGDHNVASYEMVNVNVPNVIPSGYVYVNGTYNISDNGTFDVSSYENAYVDVPQGITPTGYTYITENGDFDISTYEMVNVNVPQGGGGVDYQWIDWTTSPVLTQGDKVSFNGYLGNGEEITQQMVSSIPALADYLGWYLYPVGGWINDGEHNPWEKYVLSENQLSISQNSGVVVYGEIIDINMGSVQKMTILEDINETKYAGGNGTLNITDNGIQQVARYQSVNVNVSGGGGGTNVLFYTGRDNSDLTPTTLPYTCNGRDIYSNCSDALLYGSHRLWFSTDNGSTYYCLNGTINIYEDTKEGTMPVSGSGRFTTFNTSDDTVELNNNSQYTLSNVEITVNEVPNNANIYDVNVTFTYA